MQKFLIKDSNLDLFFFDLFKVSNFLVLRFPTLRLHGEVCCQRILIYLLLFNHSYLILDFLHDLSEGQISEAQLISHEDLRKDLIVLFLQFVPDILNKGQTMKS